MKEPRSDASDEEEQIMEDSGHNLLEKSTGYVGTSGWFISTFQESGRVHGP